MDVRWGFSAHEERRAGREMKKTWERENAIYCTRPTTLKTALTSHSMVTMASTSLWPRVVGSVAVALLIKERLGTAVRTEQCFNAVQ